jgi:hypothetical protein
VQGTILDASNREALIGANIYTPDFQYGATSDANGQVSFDLPAGYDSLLVSYVGYQTKGLLRAEACAGFTLYLRPEIATEEIVVTATRQQNMLGPGEVPNIIQKALPIIGGERDLLKALAFLPGVSMGNEGDARIMIRGGSYDQTLALYNATPVFNMVHLGGFLSIFDGDLINKAELYKGSFPARYGGRLSGVLDLETMSGSTDKWRGSFSAGPLSVKLTAHGPVLKGKSSLLASVRSSFVGPLMQFLKSDFEKGKRDSYPNYWFYDINLKYAHKISDKSRFSLSFYRGNDDGQIVFRSTSDYSTDYSYNVMRWGNWLASANYEQWLNSRWRITGQVHVSDYKHRIKIWSHYEPLPEYVQYEGNGGRWGSDYGTGIRDVAGQLRSDYFLSKNIHINAGLELGRMWLLPKQKRESYFSSRENMLYPSADSMFSEQHISRLDAFVEANLQWGDLKIQPGFRLSSHRSNDGAWFIMPEPRLALQYHFSPVYSLKASYSMMRQDLHLITQYGLGFNGFDDFVLSKDSIPPMVAQQIELGLVAEFRELGLKFSVEAYRKWMRNMLEMKFNPNTLLPWEQNVYSGGRGDIMGIEFFASKYLGRFNALVAYTLSWNQRQFDQIDKGQPYPFTYDRRHVLAISSSYKLSERWSFSAAWTMYNGQNMSLPVGFNPVSRNFIYSKRNNIRLPMYHRLDLSAAYQWKGKKKGRFSHELRMDIYNAYNQFNIFALFVKKNVNERDLERFSFTGGANLISPFMILPTVSYKLNF